MFKLTYLRIVIFAYLISITFSEIKFNSLRDELILQLFNVKPKVNLVGSALLLRFPLCKLASVATGDAKEELMTVLGYNNENSLNSCYMGMRRAVKAMTQSDLTIANRMFVNYSDNIDPAFVANSSEKYGVYVEKVGFNYPKAAVRYINRAVASHTFQRILDILDHKDVDKDSSMIIISGGHFKGTWEFPFNFRLTKLLPFHHFDGKITKVPMISKNDAFSYIAGGDCQVVSIKFAAWGTSLTVILPLSAQGLPGLITRMYAQPHYIDNLVNNMKVIPLNVILPRIKIKTYVDWTGFLQELGLSSIFNSNSSDLSGIYKKNSFNQKNIALSKVKQKTFLQIDELGAARFTVDPTRNVGNPEIPGFVDLPKFQADRPFLFQVTLEVEKTRHEMFTGVYYGPEPEPIKT